MAEGAWLLAFVTLQRLAELVLAHGNTARLRAAGAIEYGAAHYPLMVAFHSIWLTGLWLLGSDHSIDRLWLIAFAVLQAGRVWVLATLGRRWTTRVIIVPGETLVAHGPYRLLKHPNYAVVALELAVVPLALKLPLYAAASFVAGLVILFIRIQAENAALVSLAKPDRRG
jgi:methyltransferase